MRRLTVKDFIEYSAPCLICGKPSSIGLGFDAEYNAPLISIKGSVGTNFTYFDLKYGYTTDLKLYIFHRDNKFLTNDKRRLEEYLNARKSYLRAYCSSGCSQFATQSLSLHSSGQVALVSMRWERLIVPVGDGNNYYLTSYFGENKSVLDSRNLVGETQTLEIPLLPRDSFRDRAHLIDKLRTYLLYG